MTTAWLLLLCLPQAPVWDVKPRAQELARDVAGLQPMVEQIRVDRWQGPDAGRFEVRKQAALSGIRRVKESAEAVAAAPEKLGASIELLSRLDTLLLDLGALTYGLSRYNSGATADIVYAALERVGAHRESFRGYAEELAAARDSEYSVALREAQRCREQVTRSPGAKK
jgi:hypothetical protein